jgi:DUF1016 N-terminal domain
MKKSGKKKETAAAVSGGYTGLIGDISDLLESARRIVEFEQGGKRRAGYGQALLERLADDLARRFGRGFARPNLIRFRQFYVTKQGRDACERLNASVR